MNPRFLSEIAPCDVASNICPALHAGVEQLWSIALDSENDYPTVGRDAILLLINLHIRLADNLVDQASALHGEFLAQLLRRLGAAAETLSGGGGAAAAGVGWAVAEQRAERIMHITRLFIMQCEGTAVVPGTHGTPLPHGGSFPGRVLQISPNNSRDVIHHVSNLGTRLKRHPLTSRDSPR